MVNKAAEKMNTDFDKIIADLTKMAVSVKPIMPLVTTSLLLTVELVETYKKAFNNIRKANKWV